MNNILSKKKRERGKRSTIRLSRNDLMSAKQTITILKRHTDEEGRLIFQISADDRKESVVIPAIAARLLENILRGCTR